MEMQIGSLPDDHAFFNVRAIVDWTFKLIAWLGVTAAFQVAADASKSGLLTAMYIFSYILIIFYLQTLFDWLLEFRRPVVEGSKPKTTNAPTGRVRRAIWRARNWLSWVASIAIVWGIKVGLQYPVQTAVNTIAQFQKHSH